MKKVLFLLLVAVAPFFASAQLCSWEDDEFDEAVYPNVCIGDFEVGEDFFMFKGRIYTGHIATQISWWLTEYICCDGISGDIVDSGETFVTNQTVFDFTRTLVDYAPTAYSYRLHILATNLWTDASDSAVFNYVNPYAYPPDVEAEFEEGEGDCDLYIQMEMEAGLTPASFGIQIWTSMGDTLASHKISPANPDYEAGLEYHFDGDLYDGMGVYIRMIAKNDEGMDSLTQYAVINDCSWDVFRIGNVPAHSLMYPSPTTQYLFTDIEAADRVEIDNLGGVLVYAESGQRIDLSEVPAGLYIATVYNKAGTALYRQTVVKQ